MKFKIPPGMFDILPGNAPDAWKSCHLWNYVESVIRRTAHDYGYQEIRTPIVERTELFKRSVGEDTDIVAKEMYTFEDKGNRSLTMRPEGTAPVMRAFVESGLHNMGAVHKLFYIGPMFRYERQQAGRYRQHHQFGAEAIGIEDPEQDVELIDLICTLYRRLGLHDLEVQLNSIGDTESRDAFRATLKDYLSGHLNTLSEDSRRRFETNPLRILDSKAPEDQKIIAGAPSVLDFLNEECKDHFEGVKKHLESLGIRYTINPRLVRGLDYYNKTVFEVIAGELGAQNSIGAGGRYDGLLPSLGGPDLPCIGFGTGIERIIQTLLKQEAPASKPYHPTLFIIPLGNNAKESCFSLLHNLRVQGISTVMDFSGRKLNKLMQYANQINAQFVAVIGDDEIANGEVELKEMATGKKMQIPLSHLGKILEFELSNQNLLDTWTRLSEPFHSESEAEFFVNRLESSIDKTKELTSNLQTALESMQNVLEND